MKGFSISGFVLGVVAAVCGVCALVFSLVGLKHRR
jgi:hypothetical protein